MTTENDCLDAATGFKNCDGRECADCKYYLGELRQYSSSAGSAGSTAHISEKHLTAEECAEQLDLCADNYRSAGLSERVAGMMAAASFVRKYGKF